MVHIGVIRLNELFIEALTESPELLSYGETDSIADAQWEPLVSIAQEVKNKTIKRKAGELLLEKAKNGSDLLDEFISPCLTLDDLLANTPLAQDARAEMSEVAIQHGFHDYWQIFTDDTSGCLLGKTLNPFEIVAYQSIKANYTIITMDNNAYILRSDNVVDGIKTNKRVTLGTKNIPLYSISFLPEEPNGREVGPTYGPPAHVVEEFKRLLEESSSSLRKVVTESLWY